MSEVLALIGARGGSKSIPRKNIIDVAGFPLITYSIAAAKLTKGVDRCIVSTDDEEIASVAKKFGAEVPFMRPKEIAGDHSLDIEFFIHTLNWLREKESYEPDYVMHLRPTVPAREPEKLDQAINLIKKDKKATSLRSAHIMTPSAFKLFIIREEYCHFFGSEFFGIEEEFFNYPRQKLPPTYHVDGYVDIINIRNFLTTGSLYGRKMRPFVVDESCDIDESEDIAKAEELLKQDRFKVLFDYLMKARKSKSEIRNNN